MSESIDAAAFPNSDLLFKQAFAAENPAPALSLLLKEHPTYPALIRDLVIHYTETIHEHPYRAQPLAAALSEIIHSPDQPLYGQDSLLELLNRELGDTHFRDNYDDDDDDKDTAKVYYGPKNTYLLDSLLSGFSFKYNLTDAPEMYAAIHEGLKAKHDRSSNSELLVVGTCIQLLLRGSQLTTDMAGSYRLKPEKIAEKLKAQKKAESVRDPHAIKVLDLTITHAETGLQRETEREDVWSLLFPPHRETTSS